VLKELNFNTNTKAASPPAYSTTTQHDGKGKDTHNADWSIPSDYWKVKFHSSIMPTRDIMCITPSSTILSGSKSQSH
jgi:hypothetical protein